MVSFLFADEVDFKNPGCSRGQGLDNRRQGRGWILVVTGDADPEGSLYRETQEQP